MQNKVTSFGKKITSGAKKAGHMYLGAAGYEMQAARKELGLIKSMATYPTKAARNVAKTYQTQGAKAAIGAYGKVYTQPIKKIGSGALSTIRKTPSAIRKAPGAIRQIPGKLEQRGKLVMDYAKSGKLYTGQTQLPRRINTPQPGKPPLVSPGPTGGKAVLTTPQRGTLAPQLQNITQGRSPQSITKFNIQQRQRSPRVPTRQTVPYNVLKLGAPQPPK